MLLSQAPDAKVFPSDAKATQRTSLPWTNDNARVPSATFQSRTVWSKLPVARWRLSGENRTELTVFVCPVNVRSNPQSEVRYSLAVSSSLALASHWPLEENATAFTLWV